MNTLIAGLCAVITTVAVGAGINLKATDDVKKEIKNEPKTKAETYIENDNHKEYHYYTDNDDKEEEKELVAELKEELQELKSKQDETMDKIDGRNEMSSTTVVKNGEKTVQIRQDPWTGPRSYKCNKMAGYSAICEYCGDQGGIHYDIKEWQDTQGTYHVTHKSCGRNLCEVIGVEPRIEESYKLK